MKQAAPSSELAELNSHIRAVEAEMAALLTEILGLERVGVLPVEPSPNQHDQQTRVARFVDGWAGALGLIAGQPREHRLWECIKLQEAGSAAIATLERRRQALQAAEDQKAAERLAPIYVEWVKGYLIACDMARHFEQQIAAIPWSVRAHLPLSHHWGRSPLGVTWSADPVSRLRAEALAAGVLRKHELMVEEPKE